MDSSSKSQLTGRDYRNLSKFNRDTKVALKETYENQYRELSLKTLTKLVENVPANLPNKLEPINYDLYKNFINERKQAAREAFTKVKNIEDESKMKKESQLMSQHSAVWFKEMARLKSQRKNLEAELEDYASLLENNSVDYLRLSSFREFEDDVIRELNEEEETSRADDASQESAKMPSEDNDDEKVGLEPDASEKEKSTTTMPVRDAEEEYFNAVNPIDEIENFARLLSDERIKFKVRTVCPVVDLAGDLNFFMDKKRTGKGAAANSVVNKAPPSQQEKQILETIKTVKEQQRNLMANLEKEYTVLSCQLNDFVVNELPFYDTQDEQLNTSEGIPPQAFELECPYPDLKESILQEFFIIDMKYRDKFRQLEEKHKQLDSLSQVLKDESGEPCYISDRERTIATGWTKWEHDVFQHVYEQYHAHGTSLPSNGNFTLRDLMFDRMKRVFPKKTRNELVEHEEWSNSYRYYQQQRKLIQNEWQESRKALLVKAEATFTEAFEMIERDRSKQEEKEKQQRICEELKEKVTKWRMQKMEALEIQQKIDDMIDKQNRERLRIENERKMRKREMEKNAIKEYNKALEEQRSQQEQAERKKLEKLKKSLNDQLKRDGERISQRNQILLEKQAKLKQTLQAKKTENEEKEKRLEKFYESVKPDVKSDPARMISYTEAEINRRGAHLNDTLGVHDPDDYVDQKPAYKNYSFTDKQLNADARLRVEQRLRQAGLIQSDYARTVISKMQPPTQPRRDQRSDPAWNGFELK